MIHQKSVTPSKLNRSVVTSVLSSNGITGLLIFITLYFFKDSLFTSAHILGLAFLFSLYVFISYVSVFFLFRKSAVTGKNTSMIDKTGMLNYLENLARPDINIDSIAIPEVLQQDPNFQDLHRIGIRIRGLITETPESESLSEMEMSKLNEYIGVMESSFKQLTENSQKFYQSAYSQASELDDVTVEMANFTEQIKEIAEKTGQASHLAVDTSSITENWVEQMTEMTGTMSAISESGNKILNIVDTINNIASKTKLLALNATIEANRAGEHGKVFGVVAQEVRNLADHSAQAAKETADLIHSAIENLDTGNEISGKTVDALKNIKEEVGQVTHIIKEIDEASTRQAEGITKFNNGLAEISTLTKSQKENSKKTAAISDELSQVIYQVRENVLMGFKGKTTGLEEMAPGKKSIRTYADTLGTFNLLVDWFPPMTFKEDGQFKGLFIDICEEVLIKRMGIDVEFAEYDWDTCQERVINGLDDGLFTVPTVERKVYYETHINSAYSSDRLIWTYPEHPRVIEMETIRSAGDIITKGFTIATYHGNGWMKAELEPLGIKVFYEKEPFLFLTQKKADIIIEDPLIGIQKLKQLRIPIHKLMQTRAVLPTIPYQLLIGKKSPYVEILPEFDRRIREIRKDGTMERIMAAYR